MARKKAAETEVIEEVKEVVAETPEVEKVETTTEKPKKTKKKAEKPVIVEDAPVAEVSAPVEVAPVEEVKVDPIVETPVEEIKEEIKEEVKEEKPVKAKKSTKKDVVETPTKQIFGMVLATNTLYILREPGILSTKIGTYKPGTKFNIIEEKNGWGKISDGKWINLSHTKQI